MLKSLRHSITPAFLVSVALIFQAVTGAFYVASMTAQGFGGSYALICSEAGNASFKSDGNGFPILKNVSPTTPAPLDHSLLCQSYCSVFASGDTSPILTPPPSYTSPYASAATMVVVVASQLSFAVTQAPNVRAPPLSV